MITIPDTLELHEVGERVINGEKRYYYQPEWYPSLLLVTKRHPYSFYLAQNYPMVIKFDVDDSTIACDVLPHAPQWWHKIQLNKATLMPLSKGRSGKGEIPLTEVLKIKNETLNIDMFPCYLCKELTKPLQLDMCEHCWSVNSVSH